VKQSWIHWRNHPILPKHKIAKYKGFSVVYGPLVSIDKKYEVCDEDTCYRFRTENAMISFLDDYTNISDEIDEEVL
jgi:hypothetical protein